MTLFHVCIVLDGNVKRSFFANYGHIFYNPLHAETPQGGPLPVGDREALFSPSFIDPCADVHLVFTLLPSFLLEEKHGHNEASFSFYGQYL